MTITLTDFGRQLLAEGKLEFSYYAFGDAGVNYFAALSASNLTRFC